jgi:glutaredoxin
MKKTFSIFTAHKCKYLLIAACLCNCVHPYSPPSTIETKFLQWFKNSDLVAKLHAEHIASPQVQHMMKSTQLVKAPDHDKVRFAESFMGRLVSDAMAKEQQMLGKWKVQKIIEAATPGTGVFEVEAGHEYLLEVIGKAPVTLISFVDCPWCLLAKKLLQEEPYRLDRNFDDDSDKILQIVELEDLGWKGKELRASIALATGRTSMPACFIGGLSIGGYTDGFEIVNETTNDEHGEIYIPDADFDLRLMDATGMKNMHKTGRLQSLIEEVRHPQGIINS